MQWNKWWLSEQAIAFASAAMFTVLGARVFHELGPDWISLFLPLLFIPLILVALVKPSTRTVHLRAALLGLFATIVIGTSFIVQFVSRFQTAPHKFVHDGAVQTEDAARFLIAGVNPYTADYRQSAFGAFRDEFSGGVRPNPAWTHYVYLPVQFLAAVPFSVVFRQAFGWFDIRLIYILADLLALVFLLRLVRGSEWRLLVATLFLLNPFWLRHFVFGFNDILGFAFIAGTLWSLQRRHWVSAGIWCGLAAATKQSAWLFLPFFVAHLFWERRRIGPRWRLALAAALVTVAIFILPFFLWNPEAFLEDSYRYPTGSTTLSYPISGIGFSPWLVKWGVVKSMWDYYPFSLIQPLVGAPTLIALLAWQRRRNTLATLTAAAAIFGLVYWFFARYFNSNYLSYFSFFAIALVALNEPRSPAESRTV